MVPRSLSMLVSASSLLEGHAAANRRSLVKPRACLCQVNFDWIESSVKKGLTDMTTDLLSAPSPASSASPLHMRHRPMQGAARSSRGAEGIFELVMRFEQGSASDAVERSISVRATAEEYVCSDSPPRPSKAPQMLPSGHSLRRLSQVGKGNVVGTSRGGKERG
eukprot:612545-Hanusia_phi.AAC.2